MSAAVWSLLGGWWTRLLGRAQLHGRMPYAVGRGDSIAPATEDCIILEPPAPGAVNTGAAGCDPVVSEKVKRLPPSPELMQQALQDTLGVPEAPHEVPVLDAGEIAALRARTLDELKHLQQIPALQSFARNLHRTLGRVEVDVAEVVKEIAKDSALCVRILRMANSVAVGSAQRIEDLDTAVQMLGVDRVRKTAQTLFTVRDGNRVADGFDWRHLWLHAIGTAAIADELARQLGHEPPPALHLAALLHDVGKIVLSTVAPEEYRSILIATWQERGRLEDLERLRLGVDHREAGVHFARQSGLAEMVVQAIAHHDRPQEAESCRFEVALVSVANHISKLHGLGFSGARLDTAESEFSCLPAWQVITEEAGHHPDLEAIESQMDVFAGTVRAELRELASAR